MKLHNEPAAKTILAKLEKVHPVIYDVLDKATTEAKNFFERRGRDVDSNIYSDLVRYYAKELFQDPRYKGIGYVLTVLNKNGLLLIYELDRCTYSFRIRKADEEGELPTNSLSGTMRQFLKQRAPLLPGFEDLFELADEEPDQEYTSSPSLKLVVVWDVDVNYALTDVWLACYKDETGTKHFVGEIPHAATAITASSTFDDAAEELDDLDIILEQTGSASE